MWDYSFEVPILMILSIILVFYFSRPRLSLRRSLIFLHIILVEVLTILFDLCATTADIHYESYNMFLVKTLNAFYFVFFFMRAYLMYLFAACVMKNILDSNKILRHLIKIPFAVGIIVSLLSLFFPNSISVYFIFYIDKFGYHAGYLYDLVYFCGFYYVLLSFISSYLYRNNFGRRREKYSVLMYNCILLCSLVIRLLLPGYLIMDTFILMAILVVFLAFENPEYFLDLKGAAFNSIAFTENLEENIDNLNMLPLGITIYNYHDMLDLYGFTHMEIGLAIIGRYFKQICPKAKIFYIRNGRFIVLAPLDTDFDALTEIITERFKSPWKSKMFELYLSAGIAKFGSSPNEHSSDVIVSTLKRALDKVGSTGQIHSFDEEDLQQTENEIKVRKTIEDALSNNRFDLYLQPIIDSATGKTVGAEALSRIRDSEGNIIPPGIFIPIAENSGRIHELGELVFDRTCRFLKEENIKELGIEWINVNLSPPQFARSDLAERYLAIVEKYGIDPGMVHLEITESCMIDDHFLQKQMNAMIEKGFKFVLDDYGTGYSNLSRLKKCPFINVKLDMSIVWDYSKEPDEILPRMIQAFKYMGFCITAEGVEDSNMTELMKNIGCDYLQGYYYSKPVPEKEFVLNCSLAD